jgi:hypothetical protein
MSWSACTDAANHQHCTASARRVLLFEPVLTAEYSIALCPTASGSTIRANYHIIPNKVVT